MILLPRNNCGYNKGKDCPPCGRSRKSLLFFNISVILLSLVFAGYLTTTQAASDSTNHLVHEGPAARIISHTIREDDSPPADFTGTVAAAGDEGDSSSSSAKFGLNGLLLAGEDQQQHLDAAIHIPLIQADSTVNVQGKDDISINDKVRNHDHE